MTREEAQRLARGLGWFSVGLGMVELLAPEAVARAVGARGDRPGVVRACGVREIATGVGLLCADDPQPWMWARVAGDALDAAAVAGARSDDANVHWRSATALGAVTAIAAVDIACARALALPPQPVRNYDDRSGWPEPPSAMRGRAQPFEMPRDMRIPDLMRPYATSVPAAGAEV